jgi:DNA repair protein RecN (Recombination protein N)
MLVALRIDSFAIIDSLEIQFGPGLNVLTGETGAGKSILVDALSLLLGGRADPGMVRAGAQEAVVEGIFRSPLVAARARELGVGAEGDEVLVRRTVARGGGRVHVNGSLATVGLLGALLDGVVDLSCQHEHLSLLQRESQGELLDRFGGALDQAEGVEAAYRRWSELEEEEERHVRERAERERQRDFLAFLLEEMDEVDPRPGEEEELLTRRKRLQEAERLREVAAFCVAALEDDEGSASDRLAASWKRLSDATAWDPGLEPVAEQLEVALAEVREAARTLGGYGDGLSSDPQELLLVDERLEALHRIARKHGGSLEAALAQREALAKELAGLMDCEERSEVRRRAIEEAATRTVELASALGLVRREAAARLHEAVQPSLARLGLEGATLEVHFAPPQVGRTHGGVRVGARGAEEAEFHLGTNVGEAPQPLGKVASGGELSRFLLALKAALAAVDPVQTYVFDEVDAGIGGETAVAVGRVLQDAASDRQVLCVTHLPQVAAHADLHLHVRKRVEAGRTLSGVEAWVDDGDWQRGIARMLSGNDDAASLAAAAELLLRSRRRVPPMSPTPRARKARTRPRSGSAVGVRNVS